MSTYYYISTPGKRSIPWEDFVKICSSSNPSRKFELTIGFTEKENSPYLKMGDGDNAVYLHIEGDPKIDVDGFARYGDNQAWIILAELKRRGVHTRDDHGNHNTWKSLIHDAAIHELLWK